MSGQTKIVKTNQIRLKFLRLIDQTKIVNTNQVRLKSLRLIGSD